MIARVKITDGEAAGIDGGEAMMLNDDEIVTWVCHGQRNTTTVALARKMLRAAYPDWSDDQIEQEFFALIVSKGRA